MKVIDNILLEWSYRCPDGIVDLNNPNKVKILFEVLKPLLKEDIDDDILNVLTNIDDTETKEKVLKYLQNVNKKEDKIEDKLEESVIKKLATKKITDDQLVDLIILYANKLNCLEQLSDYLNNPVIDNKDLVNNNNLSSLFEPVKLPDAFKTKMINLAGSVGNVSIGKGEMALILFLKNAEKYKTPSKKDKDNDGFKGDIKVDGNVLEIKRGESILAQPKFTSRGSKSDLFSRGKLKDFIVKYNIDLSKKETWVSQIASVNADKKEIEAVLDELYPGLKIDTSETNDAEKLNTAIGLALAKEYLSNKKLLFINKQNEYVCAENYDIFEQAVKKGDMTFKLASDLIPRAKYKGQTESIEEDEE